MASEFAAHYEDLLAPHVSWMLGDSFEEQVTEQVDLLRELLRWPSASDVAVDLGCGAGIQSFALTRLGWRDVRAVDLSPTLLGELADRASGVAAIHPVHADITTGLRGIVEDAWVTTVLCMGDTLLHLPDVGVVGDVLEDVRDLLVPRGQLVVSARDLSQPLTGCDRFLQVRADDSRILTCFLEDAADRVVVHDLLHIRAPDGTWRLRTSSYPKLRMSPMDVARLVEASGLVVDEIAPATRGSWMVAAHKPH